MSQRCQIADIAAPFINHLNAANRLRKELTIFNAAAWRSARLRQRMPRGKLAIENMKRVVNAATLVKANCHCARSRNQQRKAIDLNLAFKIAAEQAEPFILHLVSELFALCRTFVGGAGFVLKVMDHLMDKNG